MKRVILLIVFFILCILTFNQCKKCNSKKLDDIRFTNTDLKIVPYNGTETLCFKDSIGDSIVYCPNGNGRKNTLNFTYAKHYEQGDDCKPDYYYIENDETTFYRVNSQNYIQLELSFFSFTYDPIIPKKSLSLSVDYRDSQLWVFNGRFELENSSLINLNTTYSEVAAFSDSIFIGPNKHYNVYTLIQNKTESNNQNLKTVFYSVSEGIVGFKTDTGLLWYLKE